MTDMIVDTWLYGELARYGGSADQGSYANLQVNLPSGSTVADLLAHMQMPTELRGITFINGNLSAMPGLQPDLDHPLQRVTGWLSFTCKVCGPSNIAPESL